MSSEKLISGWCAKRRNPPSLSCPSAFFQPPRPATRQTVSPPTQDVENKAMSRGAYENAED